MAEATVQITIEKSKADQSDESGSAPTPTNHVKADIPHIDEEGTRQDSSSENKPDDHVAWKGSNTSCLLSTNTLLLACEKYFRYLYCQRQHEDLTCVNYTPFHAAIADRHNKFIQQFMKKIREKEVREFILNTVVEHVDSTKQKEHRFHDFWKVVMYTSNRQEQNLFLKVKREIECAENDPLTCTLHSNRNIDLPILIAAWTGSKYLLRVLVKYGANPCQRDKNGNNIMHHFVMMSEDDPQMARQLTEYVISSLLQDQSIVYHLVHAENDQKLKAVDIAGKQSRFDMMVKLMACTGPYRSHARNCISSRHVFYDVTDYEGADKVQEDSLLKYVANIEERYLEDLVSSELLDSEPFTTWIDIKRRKAVLCTVLWLLFWILFVGLQFMQMQILGHTGKVNRALEPILFVLAVLAIAPQLTSWIYFHTHVAEVMSQMIRGHYPMTFVHFYQFVQMSLAATRIALCIMHLLKLDEVTSYLCRSIMVINMALGFLALSPLLHFVPYVGSILVIMRFVWRDTFGLIFTWIIILFAITTCAFLWEVPSLWTPTLGNLTMVNNVTANDIYRWTLRLNMQAIRILDRRGCGGMPFPLLYLAAMFVIVVLMAGIWIGIVVTRVEYILKRLDVLMKLQTLAIALHTEEKFTVKPLLLSTKVAHFIRALLYKCRWHSSNYTFRKGDYSKVFVEVVKPLSFDCKKN